MTDEPISTNRDAADVDLDALPKCAHCGYIIYGLTRSQCPECGATIHWTSYTVSPDQVALDHQARIERWKGIAGGVAMLVGAAMTAWAYTRNWAFGVCATSPLVGTTVAMFIHRIYPGEPLHGVLLFFGVLWLLSGVILLFVL